MPAALLPKGNVMSNFWMGRPSWLGGRKLDYNHQGMEIFEDHRAINGMALSQTLPRAPILP